MKWFVLALVLLIAGSGRAPVPDERPILKAWIPVSGQSMLPKYPDGMMLEIELGVPYKDLKEGDDVVFWDYTGKSGATFIFHKLVQKQAGSWIVQGRNPKTNPVADIPWVTKDNFIGRATGRHTQMVVYMP
jgi:phage repressor protein C with HTH and peptisase S24 domain